MCHKTLNPPGFAFESYDAMGAFRTVDNGKPVDASGSVTLSMGESFTFSDGVDFARQLSTSSQVRDCYVLRWMRYATGVQLELSDPTVIELRAAFHKSDKVPKLLVSIASSDVFRHRRGGTP